MSVISINEVIKMDFNNCILIDVRDRYKYNNGHIPGAIWMDEQGILDNMVALRRYDKVIIYCDYGNYGLKLVSKLRRENNLLNAYNVVGGYNVYRGKIKKG